MGKSSAPDRRPPDQQILADQLAKTFAEAKAIPATPPFALKTLAAAVKGPFAPAVAKPVPPEPETEFELEEREATPHECVADLLEDIYINVFFDCYAPPDPEDPKEYLMPFFDVVPARGSRPWTIHFYPCNPKAFLEKLCYTPEMFDPRRHGALEAFIEDLEGVLEPGVRLKINRDDSYSLRAASPEALLETLRTLCIASNYHTLDTSVGLFMMNQRLRNEQRKLIFQGDADYYAYVKVRAATDFSSATDFPEADPDKFLEDMPAMPFLSFAHAAYCSKAVHTQGVVQVSFNVISAQIANELGKKLPDGLNPLLELH